MQRRSVVLDILRIFACSFVWLFHWSIGGTIWKDFDFPKLPLPSFLHCAASIGYLGVSIFFILSGAVIAQTAIGRDLSSFVIARIQRLWPPIILASFVTMLVLLLQGGQFSRIKFDVYQGIMHASGLPLILAISGGSHRYYIDDNWTLPIEILFYFFVALAIFIFGKLNLEKLLKIVVFASFSLMFLRKEPFIGYSFFFIYGILLYSAMNIRRFLQLSPVIAIAGSFVAVKVEIMIRHTLSLSETQSYIEALLFTFTIGVIVLLRNSLSLTSGRIVNFITTISLMTYPMYLLHETFGLYLVNSLYLFGLAISLSYLISALAVVVISYFCVHTFEPLAKKVISRFLRLIST